VRAQGPVGAVRRTSGVAAGGLDGGGLVGAELVGGGLVGAELVGGGLVGAELVGGSSRVAGACVGPLPELAAAKRLGRSELERSSGPTVATAVAAATMTAATARPAAIGAVRFMAFILPSR